MWRKVRSGRCAAGALWTRADTQAKSVLRPATPPSLRSECPACLRPGSVPSAEGRVPPAGCPAPSQRGAGVTEQIAARARVRHGNGRLATQGGARPRRAGACLGLPGAPRRLPRTLEPGMRGRAPGWSGLWDSSASLCSFIHSAIICAVTALFQALFQVLGRAGNTALFPDLLWS